MHNERLTLATICGGAVQEKVDRALEKVAKNILDPNTDPGKKRSITLKITMKPDDNDNEDVEVSAEVSYTLAPEIGVQTRFFVNKDLQNDRVTVMEHKKGEIRGQLDFSDLGLMPEQMNKAPQQPIQVHRAERVVEEQEFDPETGEIMESDNVSSVLDFRKHG